MSPESDRLSYSNHRHFLTNLSFQDQSWSKSVTARLCQESVVKGRDGCQSNNTPASTDNLLVLEANTHIPSQMPDTIEAVEEEGECEESLNTSLDHGGPSSNGRDH